MTIATSETAQPAPYRVEGSVTITASTEGKEAVTIEWILIDGSRKKIGTISQKNEFPKGSLDGSWGDVAAQVAAAAVQGLITLLPDSDRIGVAGASRKTVALLAPPTTHDGPLAKVRCRVWTASYGGTRSVIIRSITGQVVNFTVLDVNAGKEVQETEAFVSAYAKGGQVLESFANKKQALDRAFKLCPDG